MVHTITSKGLTPSQGADLGQMVMAHIHTHKAKD